MIITCPNCQTKYQVTYEAIGSAGRKVQCASCQQSWQQVALPQANPALNEPDFESDKLFESMEEEALDAAIEAEEKTSVVATPRPIDPVELPRPARKRETNAQMHERQKALSRRQAAMVSRLPLARMRLWARVASVVLLTGTLALGYFARVQIVERNPDLAGVYEAVGLGVNVVGLDLSGLQSMRSLSEGKEALTVSAQIVGLMPNPVSVPPVLVSLLDATGHTVYEWSVTPRTRDLMAGERATFDTRLPLPPAEAVKVRLTFAGGRTASTGGDAPPPAPKVDGDASEHGAGAAPISAAGHEVDGAASEPAHGPVEAHPVEGDHAAPVASHEAETAHGSAETPAEAAPAVHH